MSRLLQPSRPVITLEDVSVCYRVPEQKLWSFKEYAIQFLRGRIRMSDFWALSHVDLSIRRGECFGIVGRTEPGRAPC